MLWTDVIESNPCLRYSTSNGFFFFSFFNLCVRTFVLSFNLDALSFSSIHKPVVTELPFVKWVESVNRIKLNKFSQFWMKFS